MYNILITTALNKELKQVKEIIKNLSIKNLNISFFSSGFWYLESIYNLTKILEKNKYDFILQLWVCWYKSNYIDFFQVWRIYNLDIKKELIPLIFFKFWELKWIECSNTPVLKKDILKQEEYIDMESYWFEFVCQKYKIPRIILKVPVDNIWQETKDFDTKKALIYLKEKIDYNKLLISIRVYLDKQPKKINLEYYYNYFNMTFTEKVIFDKFYKKYISLRWDFDLFFQKYKNLSKKEFFLIISKEEKL